MVALMVWTVMPAVRHGHAQVGRRSRAWCTPATCGSRGGGRASSCTIKLSMLSPDSAPSSAPLAAGLAPAVRTPQSQQLRGICRAEPHLQSATMGANQCTETGRWVPCSLTASIRHAGGAVGIPSLDLVAAALAAATVSGSTAGPVRSSGIGSAHTAREPASSCAHNTQQQMRRLSKLGQLAGHMQSVAVAPIDNMP